MPKSYCPCKAIEKANSFAELINYVTHESDRVFAHVVSLRPHPERRFLCSSRPTFQVSISRSKTAFEAAFFAPLFIRIQVFEPLRFSAFSLWSARSLWRKNVAVTMRYKSAADLTYFGSTPSEAANKLLFEGRWASRAATCHASRESRNQSSRSSNGGLSGGSSGR